MTGKAVDVLQFLAEQMKEKPDAEWDLTEHKQKRSTDANGLLWACLQELAVKLHTDKWSVYLMMLKRYGKFTYVLVKPKAVEAMKSQWREIEEVGEVDVNGEKAIQLLCYYGSSTYNTKEFAHLLDGVISEMKDQELKLPTDKHTKELLDEWEKTHG